MVNKNSFVNEYYSKNTIYVQDEYSLDQNNKNIFCFWDNPTLPPLINECVKNFKKKFCKWKIIMLNNTSIYYLIDKKDFPKNYVNLKITQKTDWIRLYLLYNYGGIWMDSSIIIINPNIIDEMYKLLTSNNLSIGSYHVDKQYLYIGNKKIQCIESWFIMTPKPYNDIIKYWLNEFENAISIGLEKYTKYANSNYILSKSHISHHPYYAIFQCFQIIFQKYNIDYNQIFSISTKEDMSFLTKKNIQNKSKNNIKLISDNRKIIESNYNHYKNFLSIYFNSK